MKEENVTLHDPVSDHIAVISTAHMMKKDNDTLLNRSIMTEIGLFHIDTEHGSFDFYRTTGGFIFPIADDTRMDIIDSAVSEGIISKEMGLTLMTFYDKKYQYLQFDAEGPVISYLSKFDW